MIHSDLVGPFSHPSINKARFFLIFVDDFSCFTWIYFLRQKSEVFNHLKDFKALVETVNSNLVQYLLQTDIQKRTEKIQWQIQTLHRDFSPGNPNRENQHILYSYIMLHCLQYNIHIGASGIQNPNPMTWISPKP
jgi:hypothetical protein